MTVGNRRTKSKTCHMATLSTTTEPGPPQREARHWLGWKLWKNRTEWKQSGDWLLWLRKQLTL